MSFYVTTRFWFYSSGPCLSFPQVVKYWPEIGKCGFLVWRYLLRRDDMEPAPWTPEGLERSKKLGLKVQVRTWGTQHCLYNTHTHTSLLYTIYMTLSPSLILPLSQYPPGYLEAMANKSRKEASVRGGRGGSPRGKRHGGRGRPRCGRPPKRVKEEEREGEEPAEHEEGETQTNGGEDTPKDTGQCVRQRKTLPSSAVVI